jgi:lysylphosphatidylglycerol synthetase-like protein (DUF2156 family)
MMKPYIQNGIRAGVVFGIAIIFLVLIGFNITASDLIASLLKNSAKEYGSFTPVMFNMLLFFALLGLWAGGFGARRTKEDSWIGVVIAGITAGVVNG